MPDPHGGAETRNDVPGAAEEILSDVPGAGEEPDAQEPPRRRLLLVSLPDLVVALPAEVVVEVLPSRPYATIPGAPAALAGVTNHRGRILTVVDLGRALGRAGAAAEDGHRIVVVGYDGKEIGLAVRDVLQFASDWWTDTDAETGSGLESERGGSDPVEDHADSSGTGEDAGGEDDQLRVIEVETVLGPLFSGGEHWVGEPIEGRQ